MDLRFRSEKLKIDFPSFSFSFEFGNFTVCETGTCRM